MNNAACFQGIFTLPNPVTRSNENNSPTRENTPTIMTALMLVVKCAWEFTLSG